MRRFIYALLHTLTEVFLPRYCLLCRLRLAETGLCKSCTQSLPWQQAFCPCCAQSMPENILCADCLCHEYFYDQIIAPFHYEKSMRYLITQLKFHERLICVNILNTLLMQYLTTHTNWIKPDILLPVPLHRQRLRARGFNQALEIAKLLALGLKIPLCRTLLFKNKASAAQSTLHFKARKKNIKNIFGLKYAVTGKHVGIVDDVVTTGSTVNEIAKLLKKNGATSVTIFAIARTSLQRDTKKI